MTETGRLETFSDGVFAIAITLLEEQIRRAGARGYQYAPLGYLLITLLALVNPLVSLAGFAAYAVYWALPVSGPVTRSEG